MCAQFVLGLVCSFSLVICPLVLSVVVNYHTNILQGKGYSLHLSVRVISSNLWVPPYTNYQQELFDIISKFHEVDGWNFKMISDWLVENKYLTPSVGLSTRRRNGV
jgi:hypothetical protein